ncbi:glycerol uptake facilitator protein [Entomoplasma ellychniae]|uniref:Glycerol uptake facilitator protein n=1 Tax=Entomoplasma ellychniae TaxID=2114 RepID=A0A8E2QY58_9MOLU|nr:aquaporin [Entomoplasma ellychniae]PPE04594.1 glycerol uptake facilitator protein [Entomoplasma ellychniae]
MANQLLTKKKPNEVIIAICWASGVTVGIVFSLMLGGVGHLNAIISLFYLIYNWNSIGSYWLFWIFIIAQIIGFVLGQICVVFLYQGKIKQSLADGFKQEYLNSYCYTRNNEKFMKVFIAEFIGAIFFLLAIYFIIENPNKILNPNTSFIFIFIIVICIVLSLGGITGPSLSPTRDISLRLMHKIIPFKNKGSSEFKESVPLILGSILGTIVIGLVFLII